MRSRARSEDTSWYKDAIVYELHVRAFHDGDGDGIGDFRGLLEKLDYVQDLGVTAIWLLPFYPSPLKDDGYDIFDYKSIHPAYGTLRDFELFIDEAHRCGLRVITELVLNHTSDQHAWFQRARRAKPGDRWRDFYVWSDSAEKYGQARVIFNDYESSNWAWDQVAGAYYWHRFYGHQPDLNYDNPEVGRAILDVLDFWLGLGVDGLRLDAVPYLFQREGTNCENLPETHAFLEQVRSHVDRHFDNRVLLAEANQWPEDAAAYFGDGDECHMAFHFPIMPRLFMAIRMEDRFPVSDILTQTPAIPDNCQWALFLRNHDELTLEMVTDEERDYMYQAYARDTQARLNLGIRHRLAPLLDNNRSLIDMMNGLLLSLPGTPVIYYGDEIGMGDNIYLGDRDCVRTPMQWSTDRNAGFSEADPQKLYLPLISEHEYRPEAVNVEAQQRNQNSLLWSMKRLIGMRKRHKAFGRGGLQLLRTENRKILAFIRSYEDEHILVVANLSRFMQYAELDLSGFAGRVPIELFGRTELPRIEERPYFFTLGPHAFYWFVLKLQSDGTIALTPREAPLRTMDLAGAGGSNKESAWAELERALPAYMERRNWFGGGRRRIRSVQVVDVISLPGGFEEPEDGVTSGYLILVRVHTEGEHETYAIPLICQAEDGNGKSDARLEDAVARLRMGSQDQLLLHNVQDNLFCRSLLGLIAHSQTVRGEGGELVAWPTSALQALGGLQECPVPRDLHVEESNTSIVYGDELVLKLFQRVDEGPNPDLEMGCFLTERGFSHTPPVAGAIEYHDQCGSSIALGVLQGFVPEAVSGWSRAVDALGSYMDRILVRQDAGRQPPLPDDVRLLELALQEPSDAVADAIGGYLSDSEQLGRCTAEMHVALGSNPDDRDFAPEPFSSLYQRSLYQRMRTLTLPTFDLLQKRVEDLPEAVQILDLEEQILSRFGSVLNLAPTGLRIRCHGHCHLGQVVQTGKDYVLELQGDATLRLSERRIKHSPLQDVATMLRSFHYASYAWLFGLTEGPVPPEDPSILEPWIRSWYAWVSASFLRAYLKVSADGGFLPSERRELEVLLNAYMLERAVYELGREVISRPAWVKIPIRGILQQLE